MQHLLTDLILSLTPEDGSSIGNGAMLALLRDQMPDLTDDAYSEATDALIEEGMLRRGRGRGGSHRGDRTEPPAARRIFGRQSCAEQYWQGSWVPSPRGRRLRPVGMGCCFQPR